jgi:transcription initiation factor TFIID subunit 5
MAAGFAESYIRLWSLKGEKLRGIRSDFSLSTVKDGKFLFNHDFQKISHFDKP